MDYDLAGGLTSLLYPSGRKITYAYNSDMQPTQAQLYSFNGTQIGYNYLSSASYSPLGGAASLTLGSGVVETESYDNRVQPCNLKVATGTFTWLNRTNNYYPTSGTNCQPGTGGNNGNVMSVIDSIQPNNTQTFGYDNVNRLTSAQTQGTSGPNCWGQSFGYDAWGNLLSATATLSGCPMTQLSVGVNAQNQITNSGISYDASGDMLKDGVNTYTYDAESRISTVNSTAATYTYDAEGQRIRKQTTSGTTDYIYSSAEPIAELNASGVWSDYIYAGSRRLALANDTNEGSVSNGSFEQGLTGWVTNGTLETNAANAHSGSNYVLLASTGQQVSVGGPTIAVNPGDQLTFGGWDYLEAGTGGPIGTGGYNGWWLAVFNSQGQAINYVTAGGTITLSTWTYQSMTYTVPAGAASVQLYAQVYVPTSNPTNLRVDDGFLSTGTIYYHADHLGSARFTSDSGGNVIWSATYLPFGQEWNPQLTANHYKFTGKERDSESGLDNFGARYDSSQFGRFMTPDWSGKPQGVPYARFDDPQSLNLYVYEEDNPIRAADLDGHDDCGQTGTCGGKEVTEPKTPTPPPPPSAQKQSAEHQQYEQLRQQHNQQMAEKMDPTVSHDDLTKAVADGAKMADTGVKGAMILTAPNFAVMAGTTAVDAGAVEVGKNIVQGVENVGNELVVPAMQHVGAFIETYAPWGVGVKGATDFVQGYMSSRTVPASNEGVTGWLVGRAKDIYSTYF